MKQIAIFTGNDDEIVEQEVNEWLRETGETPEQILQTESFDGAWSLTITIVYDTESK